LPTCTELSRLQSVMHAAARLIFSSSKFQHITPLLRQLHWLNWRRQSGSNMHTLPTSFVRWQTSRFVSDFVPVHHHHWLSAAPDWLPSVTELFRSHAARVWNSLP